MKIKKIKLPPLESLLLKIVCIYCAIIVTVTVFFILALGIYFYITRRRAVIEPHFSNMGKIYPTEKVSDIFEKLPNGGEMYHWKTDVKEGDIISHELELKIDANKKEIRGVYEKIKYIEGESDKLVETFEVAYSEEKGIYAVDGRKVEDWMKNMKFVFQYLDLREESLKGYKATSTSYSENTGEISIDYELSDKNLNSYFDIADGDKLDIELNDYLSRMEENGAKIYASITISGYTKNGEEIRISERIEEY